MKSKLNPKGTINPTLSFSHVAVDVALKVAQRFGISPEDVEEIFDQIEMDTISKQQVREVMAKLDLSAKQVIEAYRDLYGR